VADGYALLDVGSGARLERFGDRIVERPHPAATGERREVAAWRTADLRWDREHGWLGDEVARRPWTIDLEELTLELRPTAAGQVGLFPEHTAMLPWLRSCIEARETRRASGGGGRAAEATTVLNLFAATGHATLSLAARGATVVHVDASRPTVAWARRNAERSGLAGATIRWIVDDARAFTKSELPRGRR